MHVCRPRRRVRAIVADVVAQHSVNRLLKKVIAMLVLIILLALVAMFGVSIAAGIAMKESRVNGGVLQTLEGAAMRVDSVESREALWDIGRTDTNTLSKLRTLTFYVDMTADAATNAWVDATFQARLHSVSTATAGSTRGACV